MFTMWHSWPVEIVWQFWGRVKNLFVNFLLLFCLRGESCHVLFPLLYHLYIKSLSEIVPAVSATTAGDYQNHRLSPFLVWNGQFCRQSSKVRHENLVIRSEWQDSMQMMRSCPIPRSSSCPWLPVSTAEILSTGLIPPLVFSYASIWHQGRHYSRCNCGRCPWNSPPVLGICW